MNHSMPSVLSLIYVVSELGLAFKKCAKESESEGALLQALGSQYRDYMNRTKRLIPAVY
jgi:protein-S-isoprenylcysteine O-methyltransferase Ste14